MGAPISSTNLECSLSDFPYEKSHRQQLSIDYRLHHKKEGIFIMRSTTYSFVVGVLVGAGICHFLL
jgi:hypothetical protein